MAIAIANTALAAGEIQREYLFGVKFTHLPDTLAPLYTGYSAWHSGGSKDGLFDCFCVKAKFPDREQDTIRVRYGGQYLYYPGVEIDEKKLPFEFLLSENSEIFGFLNALKDLTGDLFNNRARPKPFSENAAYTGDTISYLDDELAIAISMVSVDKTHGSKNMFRELRNCSVYSVKGINADKGSQQVSPTLVTCDIGYDFIGTVRLDASIDEAFGIGNNYSFDWFSGSLEAFGKTSTD